HAFGTIILFPADGSVYRWVTNKPIKTGDEFQFSTSSLSIKKNDIALNNYYLISAFPNPFNPITTIKFNIPIMTLKEVTIEIFNLNGKLIETIIDNQKLSGEIRINWNGNLSPSGIYFIKLKIDNSISTHKIILLK
ncbi:MAG: T9SS type A sorting domain-containing protein, partial [Candidatus Marinimicrobia bacterium]|nr:T9SS type A sorting domain-containing protein [Candidatus Neomarinimicrobiota bacterium]